MATEYGFIYFLSNECMPGIYKIGFTMGHPQVRADQLSASTSCPMPFTVLAAFGTSSPREIEAQIHEQLDVFRVNSSREFFRLSLLHLQDIYRQYVDPIDINMSAELDMECNSEETRREQQWKLNYFLSQNADPIHWPKVIPIPDFKGFD